MMAVPGVLGILVVMLIAGVVLGALVILVAALVRSGRAGRIVAGVFAGVLTAVVLLGGLAAGFRALTVVRARRVRSYATPSETVGAFPPKTTVMSASGTEAVPAIWHEGIELEIPADVYPSQQTALVALARQTAEAIRNGNDRATAGPVRLDGAPGTEKLLRMFGRELKRQGIASQAVRGETATGADRGDSTRRADRDDRSTARPIVLRLSVEDESFICPDYTYEKTDTATLSQWPAPDLVERLQQARADGLQHSATLYLQTEALNSPGGSWSVRYHEKPWLVDFPQFQSRHRDHSYVLARSTGPATARSEADRQALSQACRRIAQILDEIRARTPDRFLHGSFHVNPADLEQYGMIVDRFSQRFYGTAGPIWRSAVLVDVSRDRLEPLIQSRMAVMRVERSMWAGVLLRLLGLGVLITVVYVFLDTATRGYYTWSLRIAAAGLAIAGVVIVLLWA